MTKAAQHFGKHLDDFWRNADTRAYCEALSETTGNAREFFRQAKMGRNGGTYAHPKLAVFFARWLDVRFAVWCDLMVDEILRGRVEVKARPAGVPALSPQRYL